MSLPEQYLATTKNVEAFFNSIINAQPPKKFTQKFLEQLEFKSVNDRLLIGVLKALGLVDSEGIPQDKYFEFIDQTQSKIVLANAIKDSYSDLFAINKNANTLTENEVKNKFKTLLHGSKSDNVVNLMAKTFRALCEYADFSEAETKNESLTRNEYKSETDNSKQENNYNQKNDFSQNTETGSRIVQELKAIQTQMHYNIQIHLPETRDVAVYEAIFKALKEHLL
jgi:hypothetical protein